MTKRLPYLSHEDEQTAEFRKRPEMAREYLDAAFEIAFEKNDPALVLTALATVARPTA